MEIKLTIEAPGLEKALLSLSTSLEGTTLGQVVDPGSKAEDKPSPKKEKAKEEDKKEPKEEPAPVKEEVPKEEKSEPSISLEIVRGKLAKISQAGKQAEVKALIQEFGAKKLTDIDKSKYAELLEAAEKL
ncbi:hypothetical protein MUO14_23965 [Halobacillus shinanisalinarum]|uniref:rRNA biogenesis protein rrp5 n=1 Tax=Halobacillus shinanisalinarum TaxID=2932258 RepID=A0ABY4GYZ1_9BACI|nr:hypothetical protein [Halobacillus shinanisalinarum]UOQ93388.1 hypothetical protein MUO14_23965 [Halobacillus shinanisalinarum]